MSDAEAWLSLGSVELRAWRFNRSDLLECIALADALSAHAGMWRRDLEASLEALDAGIEDRAVINPEPIVEIVGAQATAVMEALVPAAVLERPAVEAGQRLCACGEAIGPATPEEVEHAAVGVPLPDVSNECARCRSKAPATLTTVMTACPAHGKVLDWREDAWRHLDDLEPCDPPAETPRRSLDVL
ncbi:hypothetical protein [Nonomuraea soli]|uniref:Uncharacterized protein n=1 Tax=Nonomuraea soli TaxID=1032476 RepID=A0A7W0CU58_9ACTN|nr:hypothetical protein [Nonomuraea soli]MBA2897366.1 hypothetical protein [Nonomuraea soli]